ncbi:glycerate kinase type-2 family protein [Pseudorhodobacter aquimaris]|uniref:glycerate kinase type-2 family protein n=1 Tax=Pseudorhodobacter aquimaris TaxID=687412 RepID=UPI00067B8876|nr:glycerate kinase [Pseudorhodobacter aquimaris]
MTISDPRAFLTGLFTTAVARADPMLCLAAHLPPRPKGRLVVIGAGKASARMAEALEAHYGPCEGLIITRYGYNRPVSVEVVEAAHPVPDEAGVAATRRLMDLVSGLGVDDQIIALISGGGSSLLCAPAEGLTLADKQTLNAALLASGMPISQMNVVRKQVSLVKGGRLAALAHPARMLSLVISDVPGDDPAEIASGPTVGSTATREMALAALDRWAVTLPAHIRAVIEGAPDPVVPDDPRLTGAELRIIAAPAQSLEAAKAEAEAQGVEVRLLGDALEGEARDLATQQAAIALQLAEEGHPHPVLLLSGGECTVTRRGDGVGGPNAEYTLAAAVALKSHPRVHVLACDTDGVDGAAEVAGAYAGPETLLQEVSAPDALARNDAHGFFSRIGGQIVTGPTLTNVNDFRAVLIMPQA